jgi:Subtilase family/LysM domain
MEGKFSKSLFAFLLLLMLLFQQVLAATYTAKEGDTLFSIAQAFGISLDALEAANPQITDFDLIYPGDVIQIPPSASSTSSSSTAVSLSITPPLSKTSVIGVVIGGTTYNADRPPTTITDSDGSVIVIGSGGIVVGSQTIAIPSVATTETTNGVTLTFEPAPTPSTGPITSYQASNTVIAIGGTVVKLGTATETITDANNSTILVGPNGIIIGSQTIPLPTSLTSNQILTTNGITITLEPVPAVTEVETDTSPINTSRTATSTIIVIDHITLTLGIGQSTVTNDAGVVIVYGTNGVVVGGATFTLPTITASTTIVTNGATVTVGPNAPPPPLPTDPVGAVVALQPLALEIISSVNEIASIAELWAAGTISDDEIIDELDDLIAFGVNTVGSFVDELGSLSSHTYPPISAQIINGARNDARSVISMLLNSKNLFRLWRLGQRNKISVYTALAVLTAAKAIPNIILFSDGLPLAPSTAIETTTPTTTTVVIIPTETSNLKDQLAVEAKLTQLAISHVTVNISTGEILTWVAVLKNEHVPEFSNDVRITYVGPDFDAATLHSPVSEIVTEDGTVWEVDDSELEAVVEEVPNNDFHHIAKRDLPATTAVQPDTDPTELRIVSQPKPTGQGPLNPLTGPFKWKADGGRGINVYVFDTGMREDHAQFQPFKKGPAAEAPPPQRRFLFAGLVEATGASLYPSQFTIDISRTGYDDHGTLICSKVGGKTYGVAPLANLIAVKIPIYTDVKNKGTLTWTALTDGLAKIETDIANDGRVGKYVINLSMGFDVGTGNRARTVFQQLKALGVVIVVSSGNCRPKPGIGPTKQCSTYNEEIDQYPAAWAHDNTVGPFIVVGAVDNTGKRADFSQGTQSGGLLSVSAPGKDIRGASDEKGIKWPVVKSGTSFAAPAVAGLAAYFLSLESLRSQLVQPQNIPGIGLAVKNYIIAQSWARVPLGSPSTDEFPPVVWNMEQSDYVPPPCEPEDEAPPGSKFKRQAVCPVSQASSSLTTSSLTVSPPTTSSQTSASLTSSSSQSSSSSAPACPPLQDCDQGNCVGSFSLIDGKAYCTNAFKGCECRATGITCGNPQSCDQNNCHGEFSLTDGKAYCSNFFKGCECLATGTTCGPPQACENLNCVGEFSFNDGKAYCTNFFKGCECKATTITCGNPQNCDQSNCYGTFSLTDGQAYCSAWFQGCQCQATETTCGDAQACDAGNCGGQFDIASGLAFCSNFFRGCRCNPTDTTCGDPQNCDVGGCAGAYVGNSNEARCTGKFAGCRCNPTGITCGSAQPCDLNGCDGWWDGGIARCRGNFQGCVCTPTQATCGQPKSCQANGCAGRANSAGGAICEGNFAGCPCIPDTSTPGLCKILGRCDAPGCQGINVGEQFGRCQADAHKGCTCILPSSPPLPPPPPPPPPPQQRPCHFQVIESHSFGGGGPGQTRLDITTGGYNVYNNEGRLVLNKFENRDNFQGLTTYLSADVLHTSHDITFTTSYERASSHFTSCWYDAGNGRVDGSVTDKLDSNIVSVSTSTCEFTIICGV